MSFYVGQKVVCVDDSPSRDERFPGARLPIVRGRVYVVSGVCDAREVVVFYGRLTVFNKPAITVIGLREDDWFDAKRFRPLDEMKREASDRAMKEISA